MSAASSFAPDRLGFMILDQGGGLFAVDGVPHVMACHGRGDRAGRDHMLSYLRGSMAYREQLLRDESLAGLDGLRAAWNPSHVRRAGPADIVFVVDDFGDLNREDEEFEAAVRDLLARGPGLGIHVILTIRRWGELRTTLSELVSTKLEFSLNDVADSVHQRRQRYQIPRSQRGRALGAQGLMQVATPLLDVVGAGEPSLATSVEHVRRQWGDRETIRLRPLPETIDLDLLLGELAESSAGASAPIVLGSSLDDGRPLSLDILGDAPNVVISGPAGSGKTNLLRVIGSQLIRNRTPDEVRLYVIDPRMKLAPSLSAAHVSGAAASSSRATKLIGELHAELAARLPAAADGLSTMLTGAVWEGPRIFLLVDDAHMAPRGILSPLEDLLPFAHLFGFGVIAAISDGDAVAASPLTTLTNLSAPVVQLGAGRGDGRVREITPPGRGRLLRSGEPTVPLQAALLSIPIVAPPHQRRKNAPTT